MTRLQERLAGNNDCFLTPMTELSSDMVTCLALSTAVATCCWCSWDKNGKTWPTMAESLLTISDWKKREMCSTLAYFHSEKLRNANNCCIFQNGAHEYWLGEKRLDFREWEISETDRGASEVSQCETPFRISDHFAFFMHSQKYSFFPSFHWCVLIGYKKSCWWRDF